MSQLLPWPEMHGPCRWPIYVFDRRYFCISARLTWMRDGWRHLYYSYWCLRGWWQWAETVERWVQGCQIGDVCRHGEFAIRRILLSIVSEVFSHSSLGDIIFDITMFHWDSKVVSAVTVAKTLHVEALGVKHWYPNTLLLPWAP
jgi:hypothetical protein